MDVNQKFKVTTSDQTTHNIHPLPEPTTGNIPWNKSQPPGSSADRESWKAEEVAIPVKCNIHPWMHGYFVVVKGPYAITDENGSYHHRRRAARKLHGDRVAGNVWHADAEGDSGSW